MQRLQVLHCLVSDVKWYKLTAGGIEPQIFDTDLILQFTETLKVRPPSK